MKKIYLIFAVLTIMGMVNAQQVIHDWNFSAMEEYADNFSVTGSQEIEELTLYDGIDVDGMGGRDQEIDGVLYTYNRRVKLGGTGSFSGDNPDRRIVAFEVPGDCKITIVCQSGSGSADRALAISTGPGNVLTNMEAPGSTLLMSTYDYAGDATTLYVYSTDSGVNLYHIRVETTEDVDEDPVVPITGDRVFYIAPNGDDEAEGSFENPFATLNKMLEIVQPGDIFVMRGGSYYYDETILVLRNVHNGTEENLITLMAQPGETPILDFWAMEEAAGNDGLRINASFWHVKGIHLTGAGGNGFRIHGSNNIIENCVSFRNRLSGFHLEDRLNPVFPNLERASNNIFKNCDSFQNFNWRGRVGNMADGFAAKYDIGPGNKFYGCRSWENSDDGFDFWRANETIIVENCWSFGNGDRAVFEEIFKDDPELMAKLLAEFDGGGNGFKLGGDQVPGDHYVIRSMAFDNTGKGFDHNNNPGAIELYNNTAYNNDRNFAFPTSNPIYKNNISANARVLTEINSNSVQEGNSWQVSTAITNEMFESVDTELAKSPRQKAGSLPELQLLRPKPETFFVNSGVNVGFPFFGSAPDMGAYEYDDGGEETIIPIDTPNSLDQNELFQVSVFPNPVKNGIVNVSISNTYSNYSIRVFDLNGIILSELPVSLGQHSVSVNMNYSPGIYLLQIINSDQNIVKRIIVK